MLRLFQTLREISFPEQAPVSDWILFAICCIVAHAASLVTYVLSCSISLTMLLLLMSRAD
jgi:hypothetical protein